MNNYKIKNMQKQPDLKRLAAKWFHEKWDVPVEAYLESTESICPLISAPYMLKRVIDAKELPEKC